jgi:Na+-transporting NADH:ubiquinone oxidoreductase subunit E
MAAIREKLRYAIIPAPLRGLGIAFIITGLMGMAFMSLMGINPATYFEQTALGN